VSESIELRELRNKGQIKSRGEQEKAGNSLVHFCPHRCPRPAGCQRETADRGRARRSGRWSGTLRGVVGCWGTDPAGALLCDSESESIFKNYYLCLTSTTLFDMCHAECERRASLLLSLFVYCCFLSYCDISPSLPISHRTQYGRARAHIHADRLTARASGWSKRIPLAWQSRQMLPRGGFKHYINYSK